MSPSIKIDPEFFLSLKMITPKQIKSIRQKFGMTQVNFAEFLGVKYETYRCWEKGTRYPSSPACSLLTIAEKHPEVFLENRKEIIANIMKYFKVVKN